MIEFTTVVAVDAEHLRELRLVWPTWMLHRRELRQYPLLLVCDGDEPISTWERELAFVDHPRRRLVTWTLPRATQREKMLNALVFAPAQYVETQWYLKLDTDSVAARPGPWLQPEWFQPDQEGRKPVFISSPWGYTKPAWAIRDLDDWADGISELSRYPRVNLVPQPGANRVAHRRIISWCFFGDTATAREAVACCGERLPVASQDTFLWYFAARRGDFYRRVRMKRFGWAHIRGLRRLKAVCAQALGVDSAAELGQQLPDDATRSRNPGKVASELIRILQALSPSVARGAEVGVLRGDTSRDLLLAFPKLFLHLVDTWSPPSPNSAYFHSRDSAARLPWAQQMANEQIAYSQTDFAAERRVLLRALSVVASAAIADASLDFVFIDADHTYNAVRADLAAWWPKVRQGGVLAGHDYGGRKNHSGLWGVNRAVNEFASLHRSPLQVAAHRIWWMLKRRD